MKSSARRARDSLAKSGASLIEPFEKFAGRIESSINYFHTTEPAGTYREAHDGLREIWRLSHEDDPSPGLLRGCLRSLSPLSLENLGRRARAVLPQLFPGEIMRGDVFESPSSFVARFLAWVERADDAALITALRNRRAIKEKLKVAQANTKPRRTSSTQSRFTIKDKCLAYLKVPEAGAVVPVALANFVAFIIEDQIYDDGQ